MRRDCQFCDITVNFGNYSIYAHKVILAAALPYLVKILENAEKKEIEMRDVESSALGSLINYAYTGRIEITTENVESLLYGAWVLHVGPVRDFCCDFLAERMNCENVLEIRQFAFNLDCQNLIEKLDKFICENFEVVSKTEDFFHLPFDVVKHLIKRDDLRVSSEDVVLRAVLNWAQTSPIEKESYFRNLLGDIRIIYLTQKYYDEVIAKEEIVRQVFSLIMFVQEGVLSLSENKKLEIYPEIQPRSPLRPERYTRAVYILFCSFLMHITLATGCFLWFAGCFLTLALDNRFRLVARLSTVSPDKNLVRYIIILFMVVVFFKSPLKCLILLWSKKIVDHFTLKTETHKFL